MTLANQAELDSLATTLESTSSFVYANSHRLIIVSVCWFIVSLPLVTLGPATLAAYAAIRQIDSEYHRIDPRGLARLVSQQFVPATLFGLFPIGFLTLSGIYFRAYLREGTALAAVIAVVAFYIALYGFMIMVPTFVELTNGSEASVAIKRGMRWVAAHPTLALLTGVVTVALAGITLVLTIAFILIFAGAAFSFQIKMITATKPEDEKDWTAIDALFT